MRAYWQTVVDGPGTINMNGSGDIPVKMIKADTVEELVEKLGLPEDETLKTIEAYNGYCDAGVDEEFGKRKELLLPIKKGPFYGIECTPWFLSTTGGIRCNEEFTWSEDMLFNLEYIRYAESFYAMRTPVYYYARQKKHSLSASVSPAKVMTTKASLFKYYKQLYIDLGLYERYRLQIYTYLVAMAKDMG